MEEALFDVPPFRDFAQLPTGVARLPDESTILLRFRHLLEQHGPAAQILAAVNDTLSAKGLLRKSGSVVDATRIAAPSSTKNASGSRDPEMHQKKGNEWHFGMKAHIGAGLSSGLVHSVVGTAANVNDVKVGNALLHGEETDFFADAGYRGTHKRPDATGANWHVAMRPSERKRWKKVPWIGRLLDYAERVKASVRAKVEHPFRVLRLQFGYRKVRYRGLAKNTAKLQTLFALTNLWLARRNLLVMSA